MPQSRAPAGEPFPVPNVDTSRPPITPPEEDKKAGLAGAAEQATPQTVPLNIWTDDVHRDTGGIPTILLKIFQLGQQRLEPEELGDGVTAPTFTLGPKMGSELLGRCQNRTSHR
jgi:hypothetical protein